MHARLIVCQNLNGFSFVVKDVTDCCVEDCVVLLEGSVQCSLSSCCCAFHQFGDISAADSDRKKAYSGQYGETASYVIRNNKALVAFLCCQILQGSLGLVGGSINSLCCLFLTIFLLSHFLEDTESDGRLCGGTGFGNNIYREITVADHIDQMLEIGAADAVSAVINLRRFPNLFRKVIIKTMTQELDGSSGSQIRTADADHYQNVAVVFDLVGSFLDSCKLFFIIVHRKVDPAEEVVSSAAFLHQDIFGGLSDGLNGSNFIFANELHCF